VVRDERGRSEVGLRKKAAILASIIVVVGLVVGSLFGDRGLLQLVSQRERRDALAREIEQLKSDNSRLADDIRALRQDPAAIERIAREELGLVRPGETVFIIREEPSADHR
jgi:cell division protein FtsB